MTIADLRIRHYSHDPIARVEDRKQQTVRHKPRGLWVSVEGNGDGWSEWCAAEQFDGGWAFVYDVTIAKPDDILFLPSVDKIDWFTDEYGLEHPVFRGHDIDWPRIAEQYGGIIIAPYQWARRHTEHTFWYCGWDCASGCIWRADLVASLTRVES